MSSIKKIFSVQQIKTADSYTIKEEPISSIDLMERAAEKCCSWIKQQFTKEKNIKIFCGLGNNGGDGLAMARVLLDKGFMVTVYVVSYSENFSPDFKVNEQRLKKNYNNKITYIFSPDQIPVITEQDLLIDALFGIGLSKPLSGLASDVVKEINSSNAYVVSIDIASGLFADEHSDPTSMIIKPKVTLSFQFPKLAFMFAENEEYVGDFEIIDIGLSKSFIANELSDKFFITKEFIKSNLRSRQKFSHKGTFGHALIIAGSYGKIGAAVLAANACLHSGSGLLTIHVPKCGYEIIQISVPEAMVSVDDNETCFTNEIVTEIYSSIGIGPGLGTDKSTQKALNKILISAKSPLVIDADALNIISMNKDLLALIPKDSILTPHPKEFERLTQKATNDFERHQLQIEFSKKHHVYVVLKGAHTCVTTPDGICYFNSTGNSGMAKGGSGDILTGIVTSLLAQSYSPLEACLIGVYVHGLSGDLSRFQIGEIGMSATGIIETLPKAFLELSSH